MTAASILRPSLVMIGLTGQAAYGHKKRAAKAGAR